MTLPSNDAGILARAQGLVADVVELAHVRLELLSVEARLEAKRLALIAALGAASIVFISFGLVFLAIFLTVLFWESHRLVALGIFTALFLGGATAMIWLVKSKTDELKLFGATRAELQRDQERLRA